MTEELIPDLKEIRKKLRYLYHTDPKVRMTVDTVAVRTERECLPTEWSPESIIDTFIEFWLHGSVVLYRNPVTEEVIIFDPDNVHLQPIPGKKSAQILYNSPDDNSVNHDKKIDITRDVLFIVNREDNHTAFTGKPFFDADTGEPLKDLFEIDPTEIFQKALKEALDLKYE